MRHRKLNASDRVEALRALSAGEAVEHICATWNISVATLYGWKKVYANLSVETVQQLDQLAHENAEMRRQIAMLELDQKILQEALRMQALQPDQKRKLIDALRKQYQVSLARTSRLLCMSRSFYAYESIRERQ